MKHGDKCEIWDHEKEQWVPAEIHHSLIRDEETGLRFYRVFVRVSGAKPFQFMRVIPEFVRPAKRKSNKTKPKS